MYCVLTEVANSCAREIMDQINTVLPLINRVRGPYRKSVTNRQTDQSEFAYCVSHILILFIRKQTMSYVQHILR